MNCNNKKTGIYQVATKVCKYLALGVFIQVQGAWANGSYFKYIFIAKTAVQSK